MWEQFFEHIPVFVNLAAEMNSGYGAGDGELIDKGL